MSRVNIGGILVDNVKMQEACMMAAEFIQQNKKNRYQNGAKMIQAINTDFIVKANKDKEVALISNITDLALADGMPVVWASRILKQPIAERVGGPDFFESFNKIANTNKYSYYFLGSTEETVENLIAELNRKYPDIIIAGYECPPISKMNDEQKNLNICERINYKKPDVVWVSFGCPKQETWIVKNKTNINTSIIMGIGAAFQFYSGNLKRAPLIMQKMGFEWFFRLLQEPRRLWKRYLVQGPLFISYLLTNKEVINYSTEKDHEKVVGV
ncbi:WecB/TagA/CpsF family glycosyltransferase [Clostridium lacusfryxellense]|uniref:WecB/TagA/CpsF family glycosyltransferase n=1 Tax=Clostridium lacusfryxellense TaxID=205328 RepID=UPI001C0AAEFA|nr:WecB/TagA/CpsF family glycosyltransferase [Clostridium lacusfryxellense]MBU3111052.1 WecB/TagA/CpsF family glycosyltransferase [Clostridium lacusfryxellense]